MQELRCSAVFCMPDGGKFTLDLWSYSEVDYVKLASIKLLTGPDLHSFKGGTCSLLTTLDSAELLLNPKFCVCTPGL